ncbi:MAG TPA: hypothetical protein VHG08_07895, partial [Longimicrobium sp.]|nr:hypothetical protein [Longimicrobium sp.]
EVGSNDDAEGQGTNSVLEVTLPAAGTYQIRANSYLKHQTGAYTLSVAAGGSGGPPPVNDGGIIRPRPQQNQPRPSNQGTGIRRRNP